MKNIKPIDQVEKELLAAMESFSDEHLGVAEEAFPKEIRDGLKDIKYFKGYPHKDQSGHADYSRPEVDISGYKSHLKKLASYLADYGLAVGAADFDLYKLVGVELKKFPNDSITVLRMGKDLYINNPKYYKGYTGGHYLYRSRDGKRVSYDKIPVSQLFGEAQDIWVFPLDDEKLDSRALKEKRRLSRQGSIDRLTPKQVKDAWHSDDYDKSGYYIDKEGFMDRLNTQRGKKLKNINLEEQIAPIIDKYNSMANKGLEILRELSDINTKRARYNIANYFSEFVRTMLEAKSSLNRTKEKLLEYSGIIKTLESGEKISDSWWTLDKAYKAFSEELNNLRDFFTPKSWRGGSFLKAYNELIELLRESQ